MSLNNEIRKQNNQKSKKYFLIKKNYLKNFNLQNN